MIFGDLETTGLLKPEANELKNQPYITEIYLVKLNYDVETDEFQFVDEFDTLVRPPIPISPEITKITGITDDMVRLAPNFQTIYSKLCEFFLGERIFVAHNVAFDLGVIKCELMRIEKEFQFPWTYQPICTVEASMSIRHRRMKLSQLHEHYFNEPIENAHRARGDVEALVRVFKALKKDGLV